MIVVFLADGFEEIEAVSVIDVLRRAEYPVCTVAVGTPARRVTGAHNMILDADCLESELDGREIEMVVLPGGMPGTLNLEKSQVVQQVLKDCHEQGKWITAICAAPSILGHMGLLEGKTAICFPGFEEALTGAAISTQAVCREGKIITAKGPGVAIEFALELVQAISGDSLANDLRMSMQCQSK